MWAALSMRRSSAIAQQVQLPAGYYIEWSGQYENQQRARSRLLLVMPIVLIVIFGLLYLTYHSALEAAHVLLAVPFALDRRHLSALAAGLQLLGRRLGRIHRAVWHGGADRRW